MKAKRALATLGIVAALLPRVALAQAEPPPSPPAQAASMEDLEAALNETVVTGATKSAELSSAAPASSTVITADELRRYGIRSLDEAINYLSMGMVTQNPLHSVDIGARGVLLTSDFGDHVLLLIDGHAVNEQWDGTAYFERGAGIPFELVDHIEVILGPGSVAYGSYAMLGVINVVTKRARDFTSVLAVTEGEFSPAPDARDNPRAPSLSHDYLRDTGNTYRLAAGGSKQLTLFGRDAELLGEIELYHQQGPAFTFAPENVGNDPSTGAPFLFSPDGSVAGVWGGVARHSYWTDLPDGLVRLLAGNFEVMLRAESYTRSTPYSNNFNVFLGDFDAPSTERDRYLSLDIKHHAALTRTLTLASRLYGDLYDYLQNYQTSAPGNCTQGEAQGCAFQTNGYSRWFGLDEQLIYDWFSDGAFVSALGVDARERYVGGSNLESDPSTATFYSTLKYDSTEYLIGVYARQDANPTRWFKTSLGLRWDDDQRFGSKLSPRAATAFHLWHGGTLKAIYAEAFRAPTSYELNYTGPGQLPGTGLQPETVRSAEISVEQRIGPHRLFLGAFRSWWSSMVLLEPLTQDELNAAIANGLQAPGTTSATQYRNVSSIDNYGINGALEGSFKLEKLRYGLNVTAARTTRNLPDGGGSVPLTVAPQVFGNARLSYSLGGERPTFGLAALYFGSRPADRALVGNFVPTPAAPAQVELRGTVTGAIRRVKGLTYRATVDYAFASQTPYVAGPVQAATPDQPFAQLAPVDRLKFGLSFTEALP